MIQFVVLQAVLTLEALVALLALVDLFVVHDLMLLETDECWEDLMAHAADLSRPWCMFVLVILQPVLALELFLALKGTIVEIVGH